MRSGRSLFSDLGALCRDPGERFDYVGAAAGRRMNLSAAFETLARRYHTTEANLHNWLKKHGLKLSKDRPAA
jgi:hypothetical protein